MQTPKYLSIISNWRKTWSTKSKHLSITKCTTEEESISLAIDKAHQPSVQRALTLADGCSTQAPRQEVKNYLLEEITNILHQESLTFDGYTAWTNRVCTKIRETY
jgi:hypothetical protein